VNPDENVDTRSSADAHVSEAKFVLNIVHEWQEREGETDATMVASVIEAHTHATLALVEQQRTANLITYLQIQMQIQREHPEKVHLDGINRIADAAWEGLGLT